MRIKIEVSTLREGFLVEDGGRGNDCRAFCPDRESLREEMIARVDAQLAAGEAWRARVRELSDGAEQPE